MVEKQALKGGRDKSLQEKLYISNQSINQWRAGGYMEICNEKRHISLYDRAVRNCKAEVEREICPCLNSFGRKKNDIEYYMRKRLVRQLLCDGLFDFFTGINLKQALVFAKSMKEVVEDV